MSVDDLTRGAREAFEGYAAPQERPPFRMYAGLATLFNAGFAGALYAAKRRRRLPERISPEDLMLIGTASHKLSRLIAKDKVTTFVRAPFTEYQGRGGPAEVEERSRDGEIRGAIGELLICPYCLGLWAAGAFHVGLIFAPPGNPGGRLDPHRADCLGLSPDRLQGRGTERARRRLSGLGAACGGVHGAIPLDLHVQRSPDRRHNLQSPMRYVIVGGGILGLATARTLTRSSPDAEIVVLEREPHIAGHQTSHNSGVVHAGIYYKPGSLKARLCRRGLGLLREFSAAHNLPYEACGKLVVATEEREREPLERLAERAAANGVPGLRWLEQGEVAQVEPQVHGVAGLYSPETAISDFAAVARAFAGEITASGGEIRTGVPVARVHADGGHPRVELAAGSMIEADRVIVCAGLEADRLAIASGEPAEPRIVPFRGEYWRLRPERAHLVRGLIYPVPDPALPFLGVHLTRKTDGAVLLGPNAILSTAREAYEHRRFVLRDTYEAISWPGTLRMLRRHWRAGVGELVRSASKRRFVAEVARYVPAIAVPDVVPASAGVRAQAIDRDGSLVDDFRLGVSGNVVWVRNAPSPAATSCLAIAEELLERAAP